MGIVVSRGLNPSSHHYMLPLSFQHKLYLLQSCQHKQIQPRRVLDGLKAGELLENFTEKLTFFGKNKCVNVLILRHIAIFIKTSVFNFLILLELVSKIHAQMFMFVMLN